MCGRDSNVVCVFGRDSNGMCGLDSNGVYVCVQGLKMSVLWTLFYGLLSAFAPVYGWILFLRALVGFGIGGAPQS